MKKLSSISIVAIMLCTAFAITAATQQGKGKGKEKQQQGKEKGKSQEMHGKGNRNEQGIPGKMHAGKDKNGENAQDNKGNNGKAGNGKYQEPGRKDDRREMKGKSSMKKDRDYFNEVYGYRWNDENYKERSKIRKQEKVELCHKISGNNDGVNIRVSENAVKAHLNHGDILGSCPDYNDRRYSDVFYRNRTDYYNTLQNTQEQVFYSQSILDYALAKLTNGRSQLLTMQRNNAPLADIQRRQQSVVQLEQDVTLLESLIGVAANIVAAKLQ